MTTAIARRVAYRHVLAKTYQDYVERKKREGEKPLPKKDWEARVHGGGHDEGGHAEHPTLKGALSKLGKGALSFIRKAPTSVKKFVHDPEARRETLQSAQKSIKAAPRKFVQSAIKAAKHEVEEWKEAGQGIKSVMIGRKMSDSQKKALKAVAIEAAVVVAVTALTSGAALGPTSLAKGVGVTLAKSVAKKIALNAVTHGLGDMVLLEKIGKGGMAAVTDVMDKFAADEKLTEEEVLGQWVTALVAQEMTKLSDEDLADAIEDAAKE